MSQEKGFVSIEGTRSDGQSLTAVAVFTSEDCVEAYLEVAGEMGTPCALANVVETRSFLHTIAAQHGAVAINPTVVDGKRISKHCFAVATLLEKYLVSEDRESQQSP